MRPRRNLDLVLVPIATWVRRADGCRLTLRRDGRLMVRRRGRSPRPLGRRWSIAEVHEFARGEAYERLPKQTWA